MIFISSGKTGGVRPGASNLELMATRWKRTEAQSVVLAASVNVKPCVLLRLRIPGKRNRFGARGRH